MNTLELPQWDCRGGTTVVELPQCDCRGGTTAVELPQWNWVGIIER